METEGAAAASEALSRASGRQTRMNSYRWPAAEGRWESAEHKEEPRWEQSGGCSWSWEAKERDRQVEQDTNHQQQSSRGAGPGRLPRERVFQWLLTGWDPRASKQPDLTVGGKWLGLFRKPLQLGRTLGNREHKSEEIRGPLGDYFCWTWKSKLKCISCIYCNSKQMHFHNHAICLNLFYSRTEIMARANLVVCGITSVLSSLFIT